MARWIDVKRDRGPIEDKRDRRPGSDKSAPRRSNPAGGSGAERSAPPISGIRRPEERPPAAPAGAASGGRPVPFASAAATHLAEELSIDLATVKGTGASGMITVPDVRAAHAASIAEES